MSLDGWGGFAPGSVKATYGTGSSLMTPTSQPIFSRHGLSTTVAWASEERSFDFAQQTTPGFAQDAHWQNMGTEVRVTYALEGNIYATGAAVQWVGELLRLADPGPEVEKLARTVEDTVGVYFVPALTGLGAPHWSSRRAG